MSLSTSFSASSPRAIRAGIAAIVAILVAVAGWGVAYRIGLFPWIGAAWMSRSSFGLGPVGVIGEDRAGTGIGFSEFFFFEGQEIVIAWDAEISAGSLFLYVYQPFDGRLGDGPSRFVTASGKGEWRVPVRRSGVYHITVEPSPARGQGRGWEMSYSASWGGSW